MDNTAHQFVSYNYNMRKKHFLRFGLDLLGNKAAQWDPFWLSMNYKTIVISRSHDSMA